MITGHGGNICALAECLGCRPDEIIDFSSNINPLGCVPSLIPHLVQQIESITALPQVDSRRVIRAFADYFQISPKRVLAGCGTTQFIYLLPPALKMQKVLIVGPTYADYADACRLHGIVPEFFFSKAGRDFQPDLRQLACLSDNFDTVFICNPNNPTGTHIPFNDLYRLCLDREKTRFIIDESYLPFVPQADQESFLNTDLPNVIVLYSFSKIFGIPGLRLGFVLATHPVIREIKKQLLPWGVNALAHSAAEYILGHPSTTSAFMHETRRYLEAERHAMSQQLGSCKKLRCFPSCTPFVLIRLPEDCPAANVCDRIHQQKMLIRDCSNFEGLDEHYIRIALKKPDENRRLTRTLLTLFSTGAAS